MGLDFPSVLGLVAGGLLPVAAWKIRNALRDSKETREMKRPFSEERFSRAISLTPLPLPVEGPMPASLSRVYVSNRDQLCVWGSKPRYVDPTWLANVKGNGLYGFTPYAWDEIKRALEKDVETIEVSPAVESRAKQARIVREATKRALSIPEDELPDVKLHGEEKLYPYQRRALAFADATMGRFILGDRMRLGKTVMSIACARHLDADRIIFVTRATIKPNIAAQIRKFDGSEPFICGGMEARPIPEGTRWIVANLDILEAWLPEILAWNPDMSVIDEVHRIANPGAKKSQAGKQLALSTAYFIGLSGTPMRSRPKDLYNVLDAAQPGWWGGKYDYERAFCRGRRRAVPNRRNPRGPPIFIWVADGISHEEKFNELIPSVILRRTDANLPPQMRPLVHVALSNGARSQYHDLQERFRKAVEAHAFMDLGNLMMRMRQCSSLGRTDATVEEVLRALQGEEPVVVFAYFLDALDAIQSALEAKGYKVGRIDGSTPQKERERVPLAFQAGELDVFLGQIEASGEGIDLSRANITFHHDVTWTPFEQSQAEARIQRVGKKDPTTHYYLIGEGTIDEGILDLTIKKLQFSTSILETGERVDQALLAKLKAQHFRKGDTSLT